MKISIILVVVAIAVPLKLVAQQATSTVANPAAQILAWSAELELTEHQRSQLIVISNRAQAAKEVLYRELDRAEHGGLSPDSARTATFQELFAIVARDRVEAVAILDDSQRVIVKRLFPNWDKRDHD